MVLGSLTLVGSAALVFVGVHTALGGRATVARREGGSGISALDELVRALRETTPLRRLEERSRMDARRASALRQAPTMLDVLTLGLSAGLSFDAALEMYCERYDTELASALREALLTWRIGARSRSEALGDLAATLDVAALRRFAAAVSQALAFGSPLAAALEQQAQAIRDEQRAELEAEIERIPVKMLIPLGTLIVPAMLLAILGPLLGSSIGAS